MTSLSYHSLGLVAGVDGVPSGVNTRIEFWTRWESYGTLFERVNTDGASVGSEITPPRSGAHVSGVFAIERRYDNTVALYFNDTLMGVHPDLITDPLILRCTVYEHPAYFSRITVSDLPLPSINITYPNGGETLVKGSNVNLTWSDNFTGNVGIQLWRADGTLGTNISTDTDSDGLFEWQMTTGYPVGDYRIRIFQLSDPSIYDESDQVFSIVDP